MLKVKVRKMGAVALAASNLMMAANAVSGCGAADEQAQPAQHEVALGAASSAYSVAEPGKGTLTLMGTYGAYQYECGLTESTTDEFVRSGQGLKLSIPAYQMWQLLHPNDWEEPAMERAQQMRMTLNVVYFRNGEQVSTATVASSTWSGEAYWVLNAVSDEFVVPPGVDQLQIGLALTDDGDAEASASIDYQVVRPVPVFGGDLPDKAVLFDSDQQTLRNRVIEGGGPVAGADLLVGYTEYRADTLVDAMKIDRNIGQQQSYTRFGLQILPSYGELEHEVTMGVYFDDGNEWREVPMGLNTESVFVSQPWRKVYESRLAVPANVTKMEVYFHIRTYLKVDYTRFGNVTERRYQQGERILVAERWDNPDGAGSNFGIGVEKPQDNPNLKRTVVFLKAETQLGQDLFIRGGIDHEAAAKLGVTCTQANMQCAVGILHNNLKNPTTNPWKTGDKFLDWYGAEATQVGVSGEGLLAQGSAADWTTNEWLPDYGPLKTVQNDGFGVEPLNTYGAHYWMLDVQMDCAQAYPDPGGGANWFEVKAFVSNGAGWEPDVQQANTPYASNNHFARCGKVNVFEWGSPEATTVDLP